MIKSMRNGLELLKLCTSIESSPSRTRFLSFSAKEAAIARYVSVEKCEVIDVVMKRKTFLLTVLCFL